MSSAPPELAESIEEILTERDEIKLNNSDIIDLTNENGSNGESVSQTPDADYGEDYEEYAGSAQSIRNQKSLPLDTVEVITAAKLSVNGKSNTAEELTTVVAESGYFNNLPQSTKQSKNQLTLSTAEIPRGKLNKANSLLLLKRSASGQGQVRTRAALSTSSLSTSDSAKQDNSGGVKAPPTQKSSTSLKQPARENRFVGSNSQSQARLITTKSAAVSSASIIAATPQTPRPLTQTPRSISNAVITAKSTGQIHLSTNSVKTGKIGRAGSVAARDGKSLTKSLNSAVSLQQSQQLKFKAQSTNLSWNPLVMSTVEVGGQPRTEKVAGLMDYTTGKVDTTDTHTAKTIMAAKDEESVDYPAAMRVNIPHASNAVDAATIGPFDAVNDKVQPVDDEHFHRPNSIHKTRPELNISIKNVSPSAGATVVNKLISQSQLQFSATTLQLDDEISDGVGCTAKEEESSIAMVPQALHFSTATVMHSSMKDLPAIPAVHDDEAPSPGQSLVSISSVQEEEFILPKSAKQSRGASHLLKLSAADVSAETAAAMEYFVNAARPQPVPPKLINSPTAAAATTESPYTKVTQTTATRLVAKSMVDMPASASLAEDYRREPGALPAAKSELIVAASPKDKSNGDEIPARVPPNSLAVSIRISPTHDSTEIVNSPLSDAKEEAPAGQQTPVESAANQKDSTASNSQLQLTPQPPPLLQSTGKHSRPPTVGSANSLLFVRRNRARISSVSSIQLPSPTSGPLPRTMSSPIAADEALENIPQSSPSPVVEKTQSTLSLEEDRGLRAVASATSIRSSTTQSSIAFDRLEESTIPLQEEDKGRVKVFVRVRPFLDSQGAVDQATPSAHCTPTITADDKLSQITVVDSKQRLQRFQFDGVFPAQSTNKDIFCRIAKPLVHSALNGFNGTLMAYGQTGTGKTHTLTSSDGLMPRMINHLFRRISRKSARQNHNYKVTFSYVQIYNERIYDLLAAELQKQPRQSPSSPADNDLALRESPNTGVYVEGLSEYVVRSPKEVFELVKLGRSRLVFAETKMNRASSRSHAICFLTVERSVRPSNGNSFEDKISATSSKKDSVEEQPIFSSSAKIMDQEIVDNNDNDDDDVDDEEDNEEEELSNLLERSASDLVLRGRLSICDLAGSERVKKTQATGDRFIEAQQINLSLLELGNVIQALTEPNRNHVPFRNSILTRILQESLGGNCKTSLIVCVNPSKEDVSETKGSLAFGFRAMRVLNKARVNVEIDYKALADALTARLAAREEAWHQKEIELIAKINELSLENERLRGLEERASYGATATEKLHKAVKDLITAPSNALVVLLKLIAAQSSVLSDFSNSSPAFISHDLGLLQPIVEAISMQRQLDGQADILQQPLAACIDAIKIAVESLNNNHIQRPRGKLLEAAESIQKCLAAEIAYLRDIIASAGEFSELSEALAQLAQSLHGSISHSVVATMGDNDRKSAHTQRVINAIRLVGDDGDAILISQSVLPLIIMQQIMQQLITLTDPASPKQRVFQLEKELQTAQANLEHQINEYQELMSRFDNQPIKDDNQQISNPASGPSKSQSETDNLSPLQGERLTVATQTIPVLVRDFDDLDDEAERKADKAAQFCVVAGKECTIM